ncbi:YbaB/EbfC family nucleoid-associated protein, partial [Streptococcus thermophilus]|nr:YbaB/EbfC family nucleoid-associated protein [Streptococcus thermophilus]
MMNMQSMMKQAQKLQKQMQVSQEEIANTTFVGKSAQDLVTVEFSGDRT